MHDSKMLEKPWRKKTPAKISWNSKLRLKGFKIKKTLHNHINGLHFKVKGSENVEEISEVFRIPHVRRQNDVPKTVEQLGQNHHDRQEINQRYQAGGVSCVHRVSEEKQISEERFVFQRLALVDGNRELPSAPECYDNRRGRKH